MYDPFRRDHRSRSTHRKKTGTKFKPLILEWHKKHTHSKLVAKYNIKFQSASRPSTTPAGPFVTSPKLGNIKFCPPPLPGWRQPKGWGQKRLPEKKEELIVFKMHFANFTQNLWFEVRISELSEKSSSFQSSSGIPLPTTSSYTPVVHLPSFVRAADPGGSWNKDQGKPHRET